MAKKSKRTNDLLLGRQEVQDGRRHVNLTVGERRDLAENLKIEQAVAMFLDLTHDRTYVQIAQELDMSVAALKRLTQTDEFKRVYADVLPGVGHDPRLEISRMAMRDLLPTAVHQLRVLLTSVDTADGVRMKAIEKVLEINRVAEDIRPDETKAYMSYLQSKGLSATVFAVTVPPEYAEAFRRFSGAEPVLDGRVVEVGTDTDETGTRTGNEGSTNEAGLLDAGPSPAPAE